MSVKPELVANGDLKSLREALCVAQMTIGQFYGERQAEYKRTHINRIGKLIDQIDLLRPLGPDGKHGNRHTDWCGCDPNPLLELKRTWRELPEFEGYELSGAGGLREGYYEGEPEPYEYTAKIDSDGEAWFTIWGGNQAYERSRTELLAELFPELEQFKE